MNVLNIYGEDAGEPVELPYLKKTGDTATGLIIFDGGIEVNNGTTAINGPAEFADTVLFKPSSTIVVDGSFELTGPSFIDSSQSTEFNGNSVEFNGPLVEFNSAQTTFNGPLIDIVGAAATTLNTDCEININLTNHNNVNIEAPINLGGFGSINMVNADITMAADSLILQSGIRTLNNVLGSTEIINGSYIEYNSDNTQQTSAYTGAAAFAGTYSLSDITIDTNGRITNIQSGTVPIPAQITNLAVTTLTQPISFNPNNPIGHTYIQTGSDAFCSIANTYGIPSNYPTGISSSMVNDYVANKGVLITITPGVTLANVSSIKLRVTFSFFGNPIMNTFQDYTNWGQTSFDMDMFPACWTQPLFVPGSGIPVGSYYNLNNKIGNLGILSPSTFNLSPSAQAPNGRQYWTYNNSFSGLILGSNSTTGNYGYLVPISSNQWLLVFCIPNVSNMYSWSGKVEMLDASAVIAIGGTVGLSSYSVVL